ncbi:MAG: DUF402 domain-containing protein [Actinomycetes bacterium]
MPGESVRVAYTKWGGSQHWTQDMTRLGEDEHGVWCASLAGVVVARLESTFVAPHDAVGLFPHDQPWTALFFPRADELALYVDISTTPQWRGSEVTMVDLDLDVIRRRDGSVFVADEDEFLEHQVRYAYPSEVIRLAESSCAAVLAKVTASAEPFGAAAEPWLRLLGECAGR